MKKNRELAISPNFIGESKVRLEAEQHRLNEFISRRKKDFSDADYTRHDWEGASRQAKEKLAQRQRENSISKNAIKAVGQLISQADYRVEHYTNVASTISKEIHQSQTYLSRLDAVLARLSHEEFREHFHSSTKSLMLESREVSDMEAIPATELKAIAREISRLGHIIDALMELESGK